MSSVPASKLIEQALWQMTMSEIVRPEEGERMREELVRWRATSPAHESAYDEALRRWRSLAAVGSQLRGRFEEPAPTHARARRKTRAGGILALLALGACLAALVGWQWRQPTFDQAYEAGAAQVLQAALPDGSRIDLNARSALRATLYRDRRVAKLALGEVRFSVSHDADRPFRVETRAGAVEVLGTVFVVSDRGGAVSVEVERGRVRFSLPSQGSSIELAPGERVRVRDGAVGALERVAAVELAPWRDGWLVFDNERLADALPLINAYRSEPIRLADPQAGELRLTGRFRAADSAAFLAALPRILPVQILEQAGGGIEIRRR